MASSVAMSFAQEHLPELLDRVERGEEILIERDGRTGGKLVAVPNAPPAPVRRTLEECLALLSRDSDARTDEDFSRDVQAAVDGHREALDTSAWD